MSVDIVVSDLLASGVCQQRENFEKSPEKILMRQKMRCSCSVSHINSLRLYVQIPLHFSPRAPLYDMSGHDDKVLAVDWSMPQYMLSGGADNHLKIFKYNEQALYTAR